MFLSIFFMTEMYSRKQRDVTVHKEEKPGQIKADGIDCNKIQAKLDSASTQ